MASKDQSWTCEANIIKMEGQNLFWTKYVPMILNLNIHAKESAQLEEYAKICAHSTRKNIERKGKSFRKKKKKKKLEFGHGIPMAFSKLS